MKLLLALLLLTFPLTSVAAAYQWVDESGNVRFGSKPKAEKPEPAAKTAPKAPAKKPGKPIGVKTLPDRAQPAAMVPKMHRGEPPPLSTQSPPHAKPATETLPVDRVKAPKPRPAKPVLQAIPTLKPAPAPKVKTQPTPRSTQKTSKPSPASQPVNKPAQQKKKEKTTANTAPKAGKKISQPPSVDKPAQKKPAPKKAIAKKTPTAKSAAPETEANTEKNAELCGIFTNFASNYQNKLIDCQGASCSIYEKSLINYQKKQKTYCR